MIAHTTDPVYRLIYCIESQIYVVDNVGRAVILKFYNAVPIALDTALDVGGTDELLSKLVSGVVHVGTLVELAIKI